MNKVSKTDTAQKVRDGLENAKDAAAETLRGEAEAATDKVTAQAEHHVANAADAASAASSEFDPGSLQAQAADHVAASLNQVAGMLRDTDFSEATQQVKTFARDNPALFLSGAALLGFAAVRFLKSGTPPRAATARPATDPWVGHVAEAAPAGNSFLPADATSRGYSNGSARS